MASFVTSLGRLRRLREPVQALDEADVAKHLYARKFSSAGMRHPLDGRGRAGGETRRRAR